MQVLSMNTSTCKLTSSTSYGLSISPAPNSGLPAADATATTPPWRLLGITSDLLSIAILRKFAIVKIEIKGNPTDKLPKHNKIRTSPIAEQASA
jgi:hypothetical protein